VLVLGRIRRIEGRESALLSRPMHNEQAGADGFGGTIGSGSRGLPVVCAAAAPRARRAIRRRHADSRRLRRLRHDASTPRGRGGPGGHETARRAPVAV